jgi:hypothetical protein
MISKSSSIRFEEARSPVRFTRIVKSLISLAVALSSPVLLGAQDLAPRAYLIVPTHSNAVTLTYSLQDGGLSFGNLVPITDTKAVVNLGIVSYTHSLNFIGRSSNFTASLPYAAGNIHATINDAERTGYRSGLFDTSYRFSVNLIGGPAMSTREIFKWKQKTLVGASLTVVAPTGQYDPTRLINWGNNRWALKSEVGLSRRWDHWIVDSYFGGWYYTSNPEFFSHNQFNPGISTRQQNPVFAFEGHLSYDVKPRLWASLDGNYWHGGITSLNNVANPATLQSNSRVGGTISVPITPHQSMKFAYSNGAYIKYGGNFQSVSIAWQYSWIGRPN